MIEKLFALVISHIWLFLSLGIAALIVLFVTRNFWLPIYRKYKEAINYIIFGGLTTVINLAVYYVCTLVFHMDMTLSNILAWILSVTFAFVTNKIFVFESKEKAKAAVLKEGLSFFSARLFSLGLEVVLMYVGCTLLHFDDQIMKIACQALIAVVNYVLSKVVVFRKK